MRMGLARASASALVLLLACAAAAQEPQTAAPAAATTTPTPQAGSHAGAFQRMDANGDGAISRDEAGPWLKRNFDTLDTNHDGKLSVEEARAAGQGRARAGGRSGGEAEQQGAATGDETAQAGLGARRGGARKGRGGRAARGGGGGGGGAAGPVSIAVSGAHVTAADIDAHMRSVVSAQALEGAAVIVVRFDGHGGYRDVLRSYYGAFTPDTAQPIASATKWYTGALVESVAESGALRLDAPISTYLPDTPADKRAITVRQTISHTSGLATFGPMQDRSHATLAESATAVLQAPLVGAPGTVLSYSGSAMQVGARVAEVASGQEWRALFAARIAQPLGMTHTVYGVDTEHAPMTGGGINTTPRDMEAFTRMMASGGMGPNGRVLKPETVRDMARLVSKGAKALSVPRMADEYPGMGTGEWCQRVDANDVCLSVASIGAFGAYAWVDYEKGLYGVMFVRTSLAKIMPEWNAVRAAAETLAAQ